MRTFIAIEGYNKLNIKEAINRLSTEEINLTNFNITKNNLLGILKALLYSNIFSTIFLGILILAPTIFYFYYTKQKEIYVKKSLGFSNKDIKILLVKDIFLLQISSIFPSVLIQLTFIHNHEKIINFIIFYTITLMIFLVIIFIFNICILYMMNFNKIVVGLKYKTPYFKMVIINTIFEVIAVIFILNIFSEGASNYDKLKLAHKNIYKWNILHNYHDFNFGYVDEFTTDNRLLNELNSCKKSKILFKESEKNGGILIDSSYYKNNAQNIAHKYLIVNKNYVNLEKIKDIQGKYIDNMNDSNITILLPLNSNTYKNEIIRIILKRFNNLRYFIEDAYTKSIGKVPLNRPCIKIDIRFIENNQKCFLYNPDKEIDYNNYAINPILVVVNSDILGNALCLSAMTGKDFKAYVGEDTFNIEMLNKKIKEVNADDMIKVYNSYNNNVAVYILELKNKLKDLFLIFIILVIMLVCVAIVSLINYLENSKQNHCVKKAHGYSFIHIHGQYICTYILKIGFLYYICLKFMDYKAHIFFVSYVFLKIVITIIILNTLGNQSIISRLRRR
jgi:hypothetical protein